MTATRTVSRARHAAPPSGTRPRRSYHSRRPVLPPALFSALLLVVVTVLAGGARMAAAAEDGDGGGDGGGVLKPNVVGEVPVAPEPPPERMSEGLYFFLTSKAPRRCFVLNEGKGSRFHISLELRQLSDESTPKNRFSSEPVERKIIDAEEGSHQFKITSSKGTTCSLCAVTSSKAIQGRGLKLYLDLDTGKQDRTYEMLKNKYTLDDVQISMIQLKNQAQQMLRTADYSKELETLYHKLLLKMNSEVLWWPISQVVILVVMGFYQVRHLKKFFKSKRLV
eukprot:g9730.t1